MSETPSITKRSLVRPRLNRPVSMEQLRSAYVAFMNSLDPLDDLMSNEESDKFHDSMWLFLEKSFGWPDYASHN